MYNFSKSKKILFAIMAVSSLTFAACSQKNSSDENVTSNQAQTEYESKSSGTQAVQQETTKEQIKGVNKIALYIDHKDTGIHELADTYSSAWVKGKDIISFDAFGCDEKTFSSNGMNFKKLWESYWTQYEGYENSKIGYIVSFKLKSGEEINTTIKNPDDVFVYRNYLENYLYDDINQVQGEWYSHLLQSEVTDKTRMTSIKFTAGQDIDKVGDTIKLTAFVYNSDYDFDASGNYKGNVSYTVTIKNTAQ